MAFINTLINSLSLSLVMTSSGGGAVVIPFLTVYAVLPGSVVFTLCYAYASHHMTRDRLFNSVIGVFAFLVFLFAFVLYPNHQSLHLHALSDQLTGVLPSGFAGMIGMIRNWTFTLFYCVSELWGDVGLSLLFWGFANEITRVDRAPILYPLFGIGANLAQMLGGIVLRLYSSVDFSVSFKAMAIQMVGCMGIVIALHHWIAEGAKRKEKAKKDITFPVNGVTQVNGNTPTDVTGKDRQANGRSPDLSNGRVMHVSWRTPVPKKLENKRSFKESMKTLSESLQIRCLAMMTVAQSLSIVLMEFLWKFHLRIAYPTPEAFTGIMGDISTATGAVTTVLMLASPLLFKKLKWGDVASITPKVLTWGGVLFFSASLAYHIFAQLHYTTWTELMVAPILICGSSLYVLSRSAKFSLFKPAEEMVYISLDEESRTKGKAAVDVVGAQLGKSGGSILQQVLLMMSGGRLLSITPIMTGAYFYMLSVWRKAVSEIAQHHQFKDHSSDESEEPTLPPETDRQPSKIRDVVSVP